MSSVSSSLGSFSALSSDPGSHDDDHEDGGMSVFWFKVNCLWVLFLIAVAGGILPFYARRAGTASYERWLNLGNIFSGGIFVSAGMCHLLPHAVEGLASRGHHEHGTESGSESGGGGGGGHNHAFNPAYLLTVLGLLLTLGIESWTSGGSHGHGHGHGHGHEHAAEHDDEQQEPRGLGGVSSAGSADIVERGAGKTLQGTNQLLPIERCNVMTSDPSEHNHNHSHSPQGSVSGEDANLLANASPPMAPAGGPVQSDSGNSDAFNPGSRRRRLAAVILPLLVAVLLSFHALVEGAALGLANSVSDARSVFIAIFMHKAFASFALGINLQKSATLSQATKYKSVVLFSASTPSGIIIGMLVSSSVTAATQGFVANCFQAIAAGTFLYIGIFEAIVPELNKSHDKKLKFGLLLLGVATMSLAGLIAE
eukprot:comp15524_c0_seq1/m.23729 comp15524_c0_seq1/g.23729  ORF comp15524_c0_seq1/g.23729 comp15524_c0_seq1/m.23729 type:complete len:424 (-) comp15524_c0_seq1:30-1301(-)